MSELWALTPWSAMITFPWMFPAASRFTIAFGVFAIVGAIVQFRARVPAPVTGDPLTVKSEPGALNPTLVTDPAPAPGNVCPAAKVKMPLLLSFSPVSAGVVAPNP